MNEYEYMLAMPHHVSVKHPQMSLYDRAAQFSPFAALTGYEEVIDETARITEEKHLLDENRWEELQRRLEVLLELGESDREQTMIEIIYFQKDAKKAGGSYSSQTGFLKKLDSVLKRILLSEGDWIALEDIYEVNIC